MCSATENSLLIGCEDGYMILYDHRNQTLVSEHKVHKDSVMCVGFSASLNCAYTASVDELLKSWKFRSEHLENKNSVSLFEKHASVEITNPGFNCLRLRSDNKLLATGCWDSSVRLFGCKRLKPLVVLSYHNEAVQAISFGKDGEIFVGSKDGQISNWNVY